jgi:hypothetical protein
VHKILVRKSEGKIPPGITRLRWADNIKMDINSSKVWGYELIHLAQMWVLMHKGGKFLEYPSHYLLSVQLA